MESIGNSMKPIDKVLSTLQAHGSKLRKSSNGWEANCPCHADDTASLSISVGSDEKVILDCKAKCRTEDVITSIGLEWKDLFKEKEEKKNKKIQYKKTYEYKKDGVLVLQVIKTKYSDGKKKFFQRRPYKNSWAYGLSSQWYKKDKKGEWKLVEKENGGNDRSKKPDGEVEWIEECEKPIYRHDEIVNAIKSGKTIYIAEGEKDVDTLVDWGFEATCNLMGAGKWNEEYSKLLSGSKAVVLSDMDEAGLNHSLEVCNSLKSNGCLVKWILPQDGNKDITDWKEAGLTKEQFCDVIKNADLFDQNEKSKIPVKIKKLETVNTKAKKKKSASALLTDMVLGKTELFNARSSSGISPFATISVNEHRETYPVKTDGDFKDWMSMQFFDLYGKVPSKSAISDSIASLNGIAKYKRERKQVFIRVGDYNGKIYVDLADDKWRAVEIDADGWRISEKIPDEIRFIRPFGTEPFPEPQQGGNWQELKEILNFGTEENWIMFVSWMVAAFRTRKPIPILNIDGEQGSSKSTASKIIRRLVDPNTNLVRIAPRNEESIIVSAKNTWVLAFDNMSGITQQMSDILCSIATGAGSSTRKLYTDEDEVFFSGLRPVIINGIEGISGKPDLADRSLSITLPAITDDHRKTEEDIWKRFNEIQPRILGLLFNSVSVALRNIDKIKLDRLPRMADFVKWILASESSLPWHPGKFLDSIHENRKTTSEFAVDASVVGSTIIKFMTNQEEWKGTISDLIHQLTMTYPEITKNKYWPSSARGMSTSIRRIAQDLKRIGIYTDFHSEGTGSEKKRVILITKHEITNNQLDILRPKNSPVNTPAGTQNFFGTQEDNFASQNSSYITPSGTQKDAGTQNSLSFDHEKKGSSGTGDTPTAPTREPTCNTRSKAAGGAILRPSVPEWSLEINDSSIISSIGTQNSSKTQTWGERVLNDMILYGKTKINVTEENRSTIEERLRMCMEYNRLGKEKERDELYCKVQIEIESMTITH